jgi:hypothetical protein
VLLTLLFYTVLHHNVDDGFINNTGKAESDQTPDETDESSVPVLSPVLEC